MASRAGLRLVALALALASGGCVTVLPGPTPTPTTEPGDPTPTPLPTATTYTVRRGDTLSSIARRFGRSIGQLLAANPEITDANLLQVGQVIVIPPPGAPDTGPDSAGIRDALDDLVDRDDAPVSGPSYIDVNGFGARLDGSRLRVEIGLQNRPPRAADPEVESLDYRAAIDADADGEPDYQLMYGNDIDGQGGFSVALEDLDSGEILAGRDFPGDVEVGSRGSVLWVVERRALGGGRHFLLAAAVERIYRPGGAGDPEIESGIDLAPNQQWPRPNPRWVEVGGA